jgi:hypothetical protein
MCGRFSLKITLEQIQQHFPVDVITCELEPRSEKMGFIDRLPKCYLLDLEFSRK